MVLHNLGSGAIHRLSAIYQASLHLGYVPADWRVAKVVFIPKVGKKDYSQVKSIRPISLASFLLKTLERLLLWHIEETCLTRVPFHKNQHAFRSGRSCETALSQFADSVESAILRDKYTLAVFFDIEGAFDNVLPKVVRTCMIERGFPSPVVRWYYYYLMNRVATVSFKGAELSKHLTRGTPQGGVLSPLAWNLVFDKLLTILNNGPCLGIGYADDGLLMVNGIDPGTMTDVIQPVLNEAVGWARSAGLRFSKEKTVATLFTRRYKPAKTKTLLLDDSPITFVKETKYLGVTVTAKLNWNTHVNDKVSKCKGKLMRLTTALGVLWGPRPELMDWAFKAVVVPALTYASLVWGHVDLAPFLDKLKKVNRLAMVRLAPMRAKTPTASLELLTDNPGLDLEIKRRGILAYNRIIRDVNRKWDGLGTRGRKGHLRTWGDFISKEGIRLSPEDRTVKFYNWKRPIRHAACDNSTSDPDVTCYFVTVWQGRSDLGRVDPAFGLHAEVARSERNWTVSGVKSGYLANPAILFLEHSLRLLANQGCKSIEVITKILPAEVGNAISKMLSLKKDGRAL